MSEQYRFRGPITGLAGQSGGHFSMSFPNGYTVSVADTSLNEGFQRVEVMILHNDNFISDDPEVFVSPARLLAIMLETALLEG